MADCLSPLGERDRLRSSRAYTDILYVLLYVLDKTVRGVKRNAAESRKADGGDVIVRYSRFE